MSKSPARPQDAFLLHTYHELRQFTEAFAQGHFHLLILVGGPGLAKSHLLRDAVGHDSCWIEGNATPLGMYVQLWQHRDRPVIIDDVDSLYANPAGVRLLKCLCQTDPVKTVAWHSTAAALDRDAVPRQFTTTSRVAIICNAWKTLNDNVAAVQDRGHVLIFEPTPLEVHQHVAGWFWDQEIFDWFGRHLHLIRQPSMRYYVRAAELKQAGMDWEKALPCPHLSPTTLLVARLQADPHYPTEEARARAFVASGAGCRATYFNHARKLPTSRAAPSIPLAHGMPPQEERAVA
jgi:hypothetical protein